MHDPLLNELTSVFEASEIHDSTRYSFVGAAISVETSGGTLTTGQDPLVASLQNTLYQHAYSHRFCGKLLNHLSSEHNAEDLTPVLSRANSSRDRWDPGWSVLQLMPTGQ